MSLKVLCAGCSPDERDQAEAEVRRALGARLDQARWTVSLVKVQSRWSVTMAHPPAATITCVAPAGQLEGAIRDALGGGPAPSAPPAGSFPRAAPASPSAGRGQRATQHECASCHAPFVVRYEAGGDESEETVPVACPHCWARNYVLVAESAAESREYTAEKN
jgi:hypothetical protein